MPLALSLAPVAFGQEGSADDWFVKSAKDRKEKPQTGISGGEKRDIIPSLPGMPIPQTDRKKPPSPDYLMAKVKWDSGAVIDQKLTEDWNLAPNDMLEFHKLARSKDFKYMPTQTSLEQFSYDPALMPAILLGGVREVNFTPTQINRLRQYVLDGGMIVCDSVYGSPWFYESALKVFDDMFPESRFRVLPPDHPLYHINSDIEEVTYRSGGAGEDGKPFFEGLYIGSRIGVLVSKYGLGCGMAGEMEVFDHLEKKGLNCLFFGHKFFTPLAEAIGPVAEKAGITDHKVTTFVNTPHKGAPGIGVQMLSVPERGPDGGKELRALIETEKFDLLGLTYHQQETGQFEHYKEWFDYVLARNPKAQLLIHLPASADAVRRDLDRLNKTGDAIRTRFYATVVVPMREAFPGKKIHFWYSGRVDTGMRRRFEAGELPKVFELVGKRGVFSVAGGYPGPFLCDLQGLILYSLVYDVELANSVPGLQGKIDLNALAAEMIAMEAQKGL